MYWIYTEEDLPQQKGDVPPLCLVSAKRHDGHTYVTQAAYYPEQAEWIDLELRHHDVYAWLIPDPAPIRT